MMPGNTQIIEIIMQSHGIDVSKYDESFLDKSIHKRITETHCASIEEYSRFLEQDNKEVSILSDSLRVNYSEFFRNALTFAVLERIILPELGRSMGVWECGSMGVRACAGVQENPHTHTQKNSQTRKSMGVRECGSSRKPTNSHTPSPTHSRTRKRELRIWSAACAAGQEAYSLAILLEELKSDYGNRFSYRIFATDQDESQVNAARNGQYHAVALNNLSLKRVGQWFTRKGETYTVKAELKKNMDFSVFDLFSENLSSPPGSIFGDFDLVFCANLLFYYKKEYRKIILEKTGKSLAAGGFLVLGEVEREILLNYGYKEVFPHSAVFRKF
jgi:chemotaxis methyl-accepting protein methylase